MPRPIRATIDLAALRHNQAVARRHAGSARIWSVIKANAYGHGLVRAAGALADLTDGFAMLDFDEAVALREAGLHHPLLLLEGFFQSEDLPLVAEYRLTPVLHHLEQVEMLISAALPVRVPVYVKVNTGMNRLGFSPDALPTVLAALKTARQVGSITLMTHFADADSEERGITEQLVRFRGAVADYRHPVSLCNSAALVRFREAHGDWVRPGIMLYGASPCPQLYSAAELDLRPVMTLASEIIAVHDLQRGDRVGYGGLFTADGPMRVGVVACGYADGYPRHAPTGTPILVEGVRTRILGRVSMDMLCVDLTPIARAGVGSPVTLWGSGLPADEVAAAAGTISYELFCALARRVPVAEV
ncbi:MAG: alanine racemase [Pseudomonadota bacterium]|jgi:alanine racemase